MNQITERIYTGLFPTIMTTEPLRSTAWGLSIHQPQAYSLTIHYTTPEAYSLILHILLIYGYLWLKAYSLTQLLLSIAPHQGLQPILDR